MSDFFTKAIAWIKANILISVIIGLVAIFLFFPRLIKKIFGGGTRRRRRRTLPRSVGMRRRRKRIIYSPVRRRTGIRPRNKNGKAKKPWQIKGSPAARAHMRKIRNMR